MSNPLELTGTIKLIGETQQLKAGFTKREFVITTADKYPQDIKLEAVKDNCDQLDQHKVGDEVTVSFNVRGNEYNGKYYVNLNAWKIERSKSDPSQSAHNEAKANGYQQQDDDVPW